MASKKYRHQKILEIIEKENVERQEDLVERLNAMGVTVTQATVSRDIHDLGLVKQNANSGQKYVSAGKTKTDEFNSKLSEVFITSVVNVDYAKNIVVVKTLSGMAQAAASAVDALHSEFIVGCIAGDDTIFIVVRDEADAVNMCETLEKMRR